MDVSKGGGVEMFTKKGIVANGKESDFSGLEGRSALEGENLVLYAEPQMCGRRVRRSASPDVRQEVR